MKDLLLGIDVGTTGTKTILFSKDQGMIARDYMPYDLVAEKVGRGEQEAEDWWKAVVKTTRTVMEGVEPERVAAISLSLQGGTTVPVDAEGKPLRRALVWNDKRCVEEAKAFAEQFGSDYMYRHTGWKTSQGLNAMQIKWMQKNEPEIFAKADKFLSVPDYVAYHMTGIAALDLSDGGINQLVDIHTKAYDPEILKFIGIGEEKLGKLVPSGNVIGHLTESAAKEMGLTTDVVLVAGAHDQYAVAAGAGCVHPGDVLIGTGTAWVVTALSSEEDFENGFSQSVAATEGLHGSLVSIGTGGVCLEWLRKNILKGEDAEAVSYDKLNEMAEKSGVGAKGVLFYPHLNGAGYTPVGCPDARGTFLGLDLSHTQDDMVRAVMEGVVLQIAWILEVFRKKYPISSIKLAGGATKSPLWCQIIADVTGIPVKVPEIADMACVGAALLAGVGSGVYKDEDEAFASLAVKETVVEPIPENTAKYQRIMADFKDGAEQLKAFYGSRKS